MENILGKKVMVIGGCGDVGCAIVEELNSNGAKVLAIGRNQSALKQLKNHVGNCTTLSADVLQEGVADTLIHDHDPDIVIISIGSLAKMAPVQELHWDEFSLSWDTDIKATFLLCREILNKPLKPGSKVIIISGGPGIGGSPLTGSLSGAKRMQMFLADFCQGQSDRLNLGIRFVALAPRHIMPATDMGRQAVTNYAKYLGLSEEKFTAGFDAPQSAGDVAGAVRSLITDTKFADGNNYVVNGNGLTAF